MSDISKLNEIDDEITLNKMVIDQRSKVIFIYGISKDHHILIILG